MDVPLCHVRICPELLHDSISHNFLITHRMTGVKGRQKLITRNGSQSYRA